MTNATGPGKSVDMLLDKHAGSGVPAEPSCSARDAVTANIEHVIDSPAISSQAIRLDGTPQPADNQSLATAAMTTVGRTPAHHVDAGSGNVAVWRVSSPYTGTSSLISVGRTRERDARDGESVTPS